MSNELAEVIKAYPRAIAHMRAQKELKRLGLVFGAGASNDLGFPKWKELVEQIAQHPQVSTLALPSGSTSNVSRAQLLFQAYKAAHISKNSSTPRRWDELNAEVQAGWRQIVREALYKKVPPDIVDLKNKDPYLKQFVPIIRETPLTVNYNFDDTLERLLSDARTEDEKKKFRGYRTLWLSDMQPYAGTAVIYHPNGYLPRSASERPSDELVFLEDSFGDQLIASLQGHYTSLANHYAHTTCLFIGLSLEDSTLKHLLRQNSKLYPGHVHYFVHYLKDGEFLDETTRNLIRQANFEVHNVVTLFLSNAGIAALGTLLSQEDEYRNQADIEGQKPVFRFFLTGSVAVGKSTAISNFRCLKTHDEWLEPKAEGMEKDPNKVKDTQTIQRIDRFVVDQWRLKTLALHEDSKGTHIIDRAPLDALAFTPKDQWEEKARFTAEHITPGKSTIKLCPGALILLLGEPSVMAARAKKLGKDVDEVDLQGRQDLLKIVYDKKITGVRHLDTREMSAKEVAKEICRIIHIEDYVECDLQARLEQAQKGELKPQ